MNKTTLKDFLEQKVDHYNRPAFVEGDPISIPHQFKKLQDREIAGFFAAILSWGNRATIINNCRELIALMDNAPYDFVLHHQPPDLKRFLHFKHRTFNATDLLYCISFFQEYYSTFLSLESAFSAHLEPCDRTTEKALTGFNKIFFANDHPERTRKHISSPARNAACKRLNMYLRWMVRNDHNGVDFGIWKSISPAQLVMPVDIHVARVARRLGLLPTDAANWKTALALTDELRNFDPSDPVKYDFALFGLGVVEKFV